MKTESDWAIRNLELAGFFDKDSDYNGMLGECVKELILCMKKHGHSGGSHAMVLDIFNRVYDEAFTLEFWKEKFEAYNEFAKAEDHGQFTAEMFEELALKKPNVIKPDC